MVGAIFPLLFISKLSVASPVSDALGDKNKYPDYYNGPYPKMRSTGPIVVGGPDVILYGTIEEIHAQILERNPSYNPRDFYGNDTELVPRNIKAKVSH